MSTTSLADWHAAGRYFTHRGHAVFYRDEGPREAPVLLLIHGFPTASWDWEAVWPALASRFRTIALDMLGFGWSAKPRDVDYRIAEQADIHETLLRQLGVTGYHILAHDYGDTVAQELLARRIDSPDARPAPLSACFLNGGLFPETHRAAVVQKLLLSPLGPLVARLTGRRALARNLRRIFGQHTQPDAEHLAGFWTLMIHRGAAIAPAALTPPVAASISGQSRSTAASDSRPAASGHSQISAPISGHPPLAASGHPESASASTTFGHPESVPAFTTSGHPESVPALTASGHPESTPAPTHAPSPEPATLTPSPTSLRDAAARVLRTLTSPRDGRAVLPNLIHYIVERRERRARWVGALERSPVPLKLICGASDPISGAHMAQRYRDVVPAADVTLLDGIGHYPQLEAPPAVVRAFLRFHGLEGC